MQVAQTLAVHSDAGRPIEEKVQLNEVLNIIEAQLEKSKRDIWTNAEIIKRRLKNQNKRKNLSVIVKYLLMKYPLHIFKPLQAW